ncbi:MAG: DUF4097 family beta strand repeat-containing protein [Sandaracinaceae bacterium]
MTKRGIVSCVVMGLVVLTLVGCAGDARIVESRQTEAVVDGRSGLELDVGAGDLFVEGVADLDTVEVEVDLMTARHVLAEDDRASDSLTFELDARDDDTLRLVVQIDDGPPGYYADVRVRVPMAMAIDALDGSGDLDVRDVASLTLNDGSGEIQVERVAGAVRIEDGSGDLVVDGAASVDIRDDSGEIRVQRVTGDVTIEDASGDIELDLIEGTATVGDGSGDIVAGEVGELVVSEDGSGEVIRR